MHVERVSGAMPFSCEQIFDLAADVERYPEFLQWWISVRVLRREADELRVEQELGVGPARLRFVSDARLDRPHRIDVGSADAMFREFGLAFVIVPSTSSGCTMHIDARLQVQAKLLQLMVDRVLAGSIEDVLAAFEARAAAVYRRQGPGQGP